MYEISLYIRFVKLTLQIKLLPDKDQAESLLATLKEANTACNAISKRAFSKRIFNQFKIHKECYHAIKGTFNLSAQVIVRCISKVCDAYKLDRKTERSFKPLGSIAYDSRILSYKGDIASIWTVGGRLKIPYICHNPAYIPYIKGEADLVFKKGKFYLFQACEVPEDDIKNVEEFIGCDFGLVDICTLSTGKSFNSKKLNDYREKKEKIRGSIQRKGTKGAKKLLKRLSGRERRAASIINHTIAKEIVSIAKAESKGVSFEDLTGIRFRAANKGRKFRKRVGKWSFHQLRSFVTYKAKRAGIPIVSVNPAYTSKTCSTCHHIGNRNGKSFKCDNCGNNMDADHNAAINIATLGATYVNSPEKSDMYSCALHFEI
jgi:IS605 OrfB family transposase